MSYISSDDQLVAEVGIAIVTAFVWFAATCFFSGVVIGLLQVVSYMRTPQSDRASRFPDLSKFKNSRADSTSC